MNKEPDSMGAMWKNFHDVTQVNKMDDKHKSLTQATFYAGGSAILRILAASGNKEEMIKKLLRECGCYAMSALEEHLTEVEGKKGS